MVDKQLRPWTAEELEGVKTRGRETRSGMMPDERIVAGSVVQIENAEDVAFDGCLLVVTEVKIWGVKGYVQVPASGNAFYRAEWKHIAYVGQATKWME